MHNLKAVQEFDTYDPRADAIEAAFSSASAGSDPLASMRNALRRGRTVLTLQPVVSASRPDQILFYESEVKLLDELGQIQSKSPLGKDFEHSELARDIDVVNLEMALEALSSNKDIQLSVNMSARSIGYCAWRETMERWLAGDPTLARRLLIEIAESSVLSHSEIVLDFMDRMRLHGASFTMDSVGKEHSCLNSFKHFFFDLFKLDARLTRGIANHRDNAAIVRAMTQLAQHFEMRVIADAVTSEEDLLKLRQLGVDAAQGALIDRATRHSHLNDTMNSSEPEIDGDNTINWT